MLPPVHSDWLEICRDKSSAVLKTFKVRFVVLEKGIIRLYKTRNRNLYDSKSSGDSSLDAEFSLKRMTLTDSSNPTEVAFIIRNEIDGSDILLIRALKNSIDWKNYLLEHMCYINSISTFNLYDNESKGDSRLSLSHSPLSKVEMRLDWHVQQSADATVKEELSNSLMHHTENDSGVTTDDSSRESYDFCLIDTMSEADSFGDTDAASSSSMPFIDGDAIAQSKSDQWRPPKLNFSTFLCSSAHKDEGKYDNIRQSKTVAGAGRFQPRNGDGGDLSMVPYCVTSLWGVSAQMTLSLYDDDDSPRNTTLLPTGFCFFAVARLLLHGEVWLRTSEGWVREVDRGSKALLPAFHRGSRPSGAAVVCTRFEEFNDPEPAGCFFFGDESSRADLEVFFHIDVSFADGAFLRIVRTLRDIVNLHKSIDRSNVAFVGEAKVIAFPKYLQTVACVSLLSDAILLQQAVEDLAQWIDAIVREVDVQIFSNSPDCTFFSLSERDVGVIESELSAKGGLRGLWNDLDDDVSTPFV